MCIMPLLKNLVKHGIDHGLVLKNFLIDVKSGSKIGILVVEMVRI